VEANRESAVQCIERDIPSHAQLPNLAYTAVPVPVAQTRQPKPRLPVTRGLRRSMKKRSIGYVLAEGFSELDLVEAQAVLGLNPLNRGYMVARDLDPVHGESGISIVPDVTFDDAHAYDVLVVGDLPTDALEQEQLIGFLRRRAPDTSYFIARSGGVMALAMAGLLHGRRATTCKAQLAQLESHGAHVEADSTRVIDQNTYTCSSVTGLIEASFLVLEQMCGRQFAKLVELNLEYNPQCQFTDRADGDLQLESLAIERPPRIAVILPPSSYFPDVIGAIAVLSQIPEAELLIVSHDLSPSKCILGPSVVATTTFRDCPQADIIIVGATVPRHLKDSDILHFVRRQEPASRAMISVCVGTLLYAAAGVLDGRTATSNFHHTALLGKLGVMPSGTETAVDGKFYSAGPAIGAIEVGLKVVADLYGEALARDIERDYLDYRPDPVYGAGTPASAGPLMSWLSRALSLPSLPWLLRNARLGRTRLLAGTSAGSKRQAPA